MVELLVHHLPQLKLLRGVELAEGVLGLIEELLLLEDAVSVLVGVFEQAGQLGLVSVFLFGELAHLEEQDACRGQFEVSVSVLIGQRSHAFHLVPLLWLFDLSQEVTHVVGL